MDQHGTGTYTSPMEEYIKWTTPFWNSAFFDELDLLDEHKDILIVEDDSDTIKLFKKMFRTSDENCRIESMTTAEDAIRFLRNTKKPQSEMIAVFIFSDLLFL